MLRCVVAACLAAGAFVADAAVFARVSAEPLPDVLFSKQPISSQYYVGGSLSWIHHTGYVPNKAAGEAKDVEKYVFGGKLFGGYRYSDAVRFEIAYHHLGNAPYQEGFGATISTSHVQSYALSGSVIYAFPELPPWFGHASLPSRVFVRGGFTVKNIQQQTIQGSFEEGTFAFVVGTGVEVKLTPRWFSRFEVEHLSVAIGGPIHSAPLLRGLINVGIGGTNHVPNVMHTQLMFTLGYNL
jgi:hypothetical protein